MCGGGIAADRGYFIQPTVFGDVQDNMTIAREEVGRRIITIITVTVLYQCTLVVQTKSCKPTLRTNTLTLNLQQGLGCWEFPMMH